MQYALLFYQSPDEFAARTDPKKREAFWASFIPYMKALTEAGIVVAGAGLEPPAVATSVRLNGGKRQVQDGPFAEPRSNSAASSSSTWPISTWRSNGPPATRPDQPAVSRCAPCAADGSRENAERRRPRQRRRDARRTIMPDGRASEAVEQAARRSYGRLLAFLASRSRDVTASEDCLARRVVSSGADGLAARWGSRQPGRLVADGRAAALDRHGPARDRSPAGGAGLILGRRGDCGVDDDNRISRRASEAAVRLRASGHRFAAMHTPLMLQTVLGLNATRIASAFLVSPDAMGRRLSRAKTKINDAGIPFEVPENRAIAAAPPRRSRGDLRRLRQRLG